MPSHPLSYNVHTPKQSQNGKKWVQKMVRGKSKTGLVTSIFATYVIVAAVIGFAMFSFQDSSQASTESAFVSASLRLVDETDYKIGSKIETSLTIQNTSITDPISNLNIEFNSTKNSVRWDSALLKSNIIQTRELKPSGNVITIPLLAAGERVEYAVNGTLTTNDFDFLTLVGRLTFKNREGLQNSTTNRVFTKLQDTSNRGNLLALKMEKDTFTKAEEIKFALSYTNSNGEVDPLAPQTKGKIYITQKDTSSTIAGLDCEIVNTPECLISIEKLEPGNYTALFIDQTEQIFSQIASFKVTGEAGTFTPNSLAILNFPFNSQSINGIVPVKASKVISLNDKITGQKCVFEILKGDSIITRAESSVDQDRTCSTTLDSSHFNQGNSEYTVRLGGTSKQGNILFSQKSPNLLPLTNLTTVMKSGNSVQIGSTGITKLTIEEGEETPGLLESAKATLGMWHPRSGEYKEITNFGGSPIEVVDGQLNINIPSNEFNKSGFYSVYLKLEDGRYTEFLGLSFEDEKIGFSQSGVLVEDLNKLKVGEDITFKLENVTDRSGNKITQAECALNLYQTATGPIPVSEKGEIKDGICKVTVPKGKIVRSGPIMVTFTGDNITNRINQSRQLYVSPNVPTNYGFLGFEYEPVTENYANNIIIGPVTDIYGNTTNALEHTVQIYDITPKEILVAETEETDVQATTEAQTSTTIVEPTLLAQYPVSIEDGFARVTAPSSLFTIGRLKVILLNSNKELIKEKEVEVRETPEKLILPNFPKELNSDDKINLGLTDLNIETVSECSLLYFRSQNEFSENKVKVNPDTNSCEFDWNLNQFRDNPKALMQLQAGENIYSHIVKHLSGQASNLFTTAPQMRINERDELEIELLSSPIVDINGRPVKIGSVRWEYNNKTEDTNLFDGFATLNITADKINTRDLRNVLDQKYLELSLDARASITSINKTRSLSIYLSTKDISNTRETFSIESAMSQIFLDSKQIFQFQTPACNANILSDQTSQKNIRTHWQGGTCYVEVGGPIGNHRLIFEENGFTLGTFDFSVSQEKTEINWCNQNPCQIQIITQNRGSIEATIFDGEKQYKFESDSLDNLILLEQTGLNPLKEYLVKIQFTGENGGITTIYKTIPGEFLQFSKTTN